MNHPPKIAQQLLKWFAGRADLEDIQGDLDEVYLQNSQGSKKWKADLNYWKQVFSLLFSYGLKKRKSKASYSNYYHKNSMAMFKNYFKVAVRNFAKQKLFTTINIIGLAMGMSVSLLILGVLSQVMQFDTFHENGDDLYRVVTNIKDIDGKRTYATSPLAVYDELISNYSGIKEATRINYSLGLAVIHNQGEIQVSGIYTDPSYLDMFTFPLAEGNAETALSKPRSIIITKTIAEKLFPNGNAFGQVLETKDQGAYTITGILEEHPRQTHLKVDALASFNTIESSLNKSQAWTDFSGNYVYVQAFPDKSAGSFSSMLEDLTDHAQSFHEELSIGFELQAFSNISPGKYLFRDNTPFDWLMSILLFCLGLLILIPACFNYTNLMIARGLKRAKEIGMRKVVGSSKNQIKYQFIVEAVLLTSIALIGSIFIFMLIRSEFSAMVIGADLLDLSLSFNMIIWFVAFGLLAGIGAGAFPAFYFSKVEPLKSLKAEMQSGSSKISTIRKSLIVVQFTISLVFIIGIGVILKQHKDMLTYDLGFNKENVLAVPLQNLDPQIVANEFGTLSGVKQMSFSSNLPGIEAGLLKNMVRNASNAEDSVQVYEMFVDDQFINSLNFEVKWGEGFSRSPMVAEQLLANEEFMRISRNLNPEVDSLTLLLEGNKKGNIVGVVKDFNFMQLNMEIQPMIIRYNPEKARYALLKVGGENLLEIVDQLEDKWEGIDQEAKFESFFLDQEIEDAYQSAFSIVKIFGFLGALSLTISCIGLLGMVVYFIENRVKEVAVRKIMGATLKDLYVTLGGSFMKLIFIAIFIATPISYFFYDKLFVQMISKYSVGVGWSEVVGSILFMLLLASLPILWMITKISDVNPAENLRYE